MSDFITRHYKPGDQAAVMAIAADTAFFGEPVEAFLEDRKLYGDAFARYYVENEALYLWVADSPEGIVGFLLGCIDTKQQSKLWRRYIIRKVLINALRGYYKLGRRTAGFALGMMMGFLRGEEPKIDLSEYPAHLQIDVKQGYRGQGAGRELIGSYLAQLVELKVGGVHLKTTSHNLAACHLYEKSGFKLLDHRHNRYWSRWMGYSIENRSYALRLKP